MQECLISVMFNEETTLTFASSRLFCTLLYLNMYVCSFVFLSVVVLGGLLWWVFWLVGCFLSGGGGVGWVVVSWVLFLEKQGWLFKKQNQWGKKHKQNGERWEVTLKMEGRRNCLEKMSSFAPSYCSLILLQMERKEKYIYKKN